MTTFEQRPSGIVVPADPPPKPKPCEGGCLYCGSGWICTIGSLGPEKFPQNLCGNCHRWYPIEEHDREVAKRIIAEISTQQPTWTTARPTNPGWYWLGHGWFNPAECVRVFANEHRNDQLCIEGCNGAIPLTSIDAEWAGPLSLPCY